VDLKRPCSFARGFLNFLKYSPNVKGPWAAIKTRWRERLGLVIIGSQSVIIRQRNMGGLSLMHWVIVAVIVILLFGTRKLPELGSGLGQAISNFRQALRHDNQIPDKTREEKDTPDKT
jgi:sec-independent protein translocase protein TatA